MYEIYPVIDEMTCDKSKLSSNSLMSHEQAAADSSKPLQADGDKPQLGFVSFLLCLGLRVPPSAAHSAAYCCPLLPFAAF